MSDISPKRFKTSADKIVEKAHRHGHWPVFEQYDVKGLPGCRYICAPHAIDKDTRNEYWFLEALSPSNAGLFLEFSSWPVNRSMDKAVETDPEFPPTLDTERNAEAAREWAELYGVLGLGAGPHEVHFVGGTSSLSMVAAKYTGASALGDTPTRGYRNSPRGGMHETVEAFAFEAWQAYLARRLYELASRKVLDEVAIVRLMDDTPRGYREAWSEREQWAEDTWSVRRWALGIVEEAVMAKVEKTHYLTLELTSEDWPVSYKQGAGIRSLLGAMWLQMMWLMIGEDNTCDWCGSLLAPTRKDKRFCDNRGRCRQKWNYHRGTGKSSSQARKEKRDRENKGPDSEKNESCG